MSYWLPLSDRIEDFSTTILHDAKPSHASIAKRLAPTLRARLPWIAWAGPTLRTFGYDGQPRVRGDSGVRAHCTRCGTTLPPGKMSCPSCGIELGGETVLDVHAVDTGGGSAEILAERHDAERQRDREPGQARCAECERTTLVRREHRRGDRSPYSRLEIQIRCPRHRRRQDRERRDQSCDCAGSAEAERRRFKPSVRKLERSANPVSAQCRRSYRVA